MPVINTSKLKRIETLENCLRSGYFFDDFFQSTSPALSGYNFGRYFTKIFSGTGAGITSCNSEGLNLKLKE